MRIYLLHANVNNYQMLALLGESTLERYRKFDGTPLPDSMDALAVEIMPGEQNQPTGDFPGLTSHIPVFSQRAVKALEDLLAPAGELIPLHCAACEDDYVAMNVTRLIDALDKQRSAVKRFRSGRIMRILRYEFLVDRLQGATLFKLPEKVLQNLYVTEPFVERVVEHALRGFEFRLIWTDAPYVLRCPYCMGVIAEDTELCPTCGLDTTRDAVLETSLHEMKEMKHVSCPFCKTRIPALADPCPYCKRGKRRRGTREGPVII